MKASVLALKQHPELNSSLSPEKDALILKRYYHIGVAASTPDGLVVPVIRDVDRKGIVELSQELAAASKRARDGKLSPSDMQGGASPSQAWAASAAQASPRSSTHPRSRSSAWSAPGMAPVWNGESFVPAADASARSPMTTA